MNIKIHKILLGSRANGPGIRNTVWFQGCSLGCPGCFNPRTHDAEKGETMPVSRVCELLLSASPCEGITISGGEPFQQAEALLELLTLLREKNSPPILIFSGYTESYLRADKVCSACLDKTDALICGPYRQDLPPAYERFCASENQKLLLFTRHMAYDDFSGLPLSEVIIDPQGNTMITGIQF